MAKKLRVGILFGGRSGEHTVSLLSAASVMAAMDKNRYEIIPVGITEEGQWLAGGDPLRCLKKKEIPGDCCFTSLVTDPISPGLIFLSKEGQNREFIPLDAVFPVLHGTYGEDGTIQGLLELANLPYVGAGVLSSAVGMDKVFMKVLFSYHGLPVGEFISFKSFQWSRDRKPIIKMIEEKLGYPCFIKPANLGSSVGISKASDHGSLLQGIEDAFNYDHKVIVEAFIKGREIECSVLGHNEPISSVPGEIIPGADFYDYNAKYLDESSRLIIPAPLDQEAEEKIKQYAVLAFQAVECSGLGRVDFFYDEKEEKIFVNEINTIPGFTSISMYPKLWEKSGIPYGKLIDRLIEVALEKHEEKSRLKFNS
ncbi:MAG: D-alanine--D-alanine ligase family protein [Bacillota bacterium]|nr:D-alanine--D-alanine ligase family protein [Bacillota bacterium]